MVPRWNLEDSMPVTAYVLYFYLNFNLEVRPFDLKLHGGLYVRLATFSVGLTFQWFPLMS